MTMRTTTTPEPRRTDALWYGGWYRFARALRSPNAGARPAGAKVDLIVLHSISLPPGAYGGDAVQRLFTNTLDWDAHPYFAAIRGLEVSAHFYIRRDRAPSPHRRCRGARACRAGPQARPGRRLRLGSFATLDGLAASVFSRRRVAFCRRLIRPGAGPRGQLRAARSSARRPRISSNDAVIAAKNAGSARAVSARRGTS